jgi:hypothetical protein
VTAGAPILKAASTSGSMRHDSIAASPDGSF